MEPGDRIVRIDGQQNPTWEDVLLKVVVTTKGPVDVAIQRGNEVLEKQIQPEFDGSDQYDNVGWLPEEPITVTYLEPNMPAVKAGLKVGDEVVAVNGAKMRSLLSVIYYLRQNGEKPVDVTLLRNGQKLDIKVTPVQTEDNGQKNYRLGFQSRPVQIDKLPFAQALNRSLDENKRYSVLIVDLVRKLVQHKASIKQMEGPIGIARASGDAARQPGWAPLLRLMAMISLNLGIFNLLPIPILDGGIILLLVIEGVLRREIKPHIKERIYQTAFVFLILFAAVVIYNDLMKALPGLAQRLP
jgi:regulator of sigma E protease